SAVTRPSHARFEKIFPRSRRIRHGQPLLRPGYRRRDAPTVDAAVTSRHRNVRSTECRAIARRALTGSVLCFALWLPASASTGATPTSTADSGLRARLVGFRVGAHRGGMPSPDQNTIEHFEKARQDGVDIVETDLRTSLDGEVFLFHDRRLDDLTTCVGPIDAKTAVQLRDC